MSHYESCKLISSFIIQLIVRKFIIIYFDMIESF